MRALLLLRKLETNKPFANTPITFGPFNLWDQKRWKKPPNTAITRLENRTFDKKLEALSYKLRRLDIALKVFDLMSNRPYVMMQTMSSWVKSVGLKIRMSQFVIKYPHIFEVFKHPMSRKWCCSVRRKMRDLIREDKVAMRKREAENVVMLKKLFMMSKKGSLHLNALRLVRRELGLPVDFRESILRKYSEDFQFVNVEIVALAKRDEGLALAKVEAWREKEFTEKWLSEFEIRYAFPLYFPIEFEKRSGFKEKMMNWQRLSYDTPYEEEGPRKGTQAAVERFQKRVVGVVHEFLSLTVEKKAPVERFAHFRKDLGLAVNMRELLLKHPGIFYISLRGNAVNVYLREAYSKDRLIEPNEIYTVRRKMLELVKLRWHHIKELKPETFITEKRKAVLLTRKIVQRRKRFGNCLISILGESKK